jgi:peptidoglycan/xylan/chitin deacetylase (PgdA/CDA1 family)
LKRFPPVVTVLATGLAAGVIGYLISPARALRLPGVKSPAEVMGQFPKIAAGETKKPEDTGVPTGLFEGTSRAAVLMYHDVTDHPAVYFDVSTTEFKRHLELLKSSGANVVPLQDLYDHMRFGRKLPERAVVLTFDDGYLGQFETVYPLLKKYNFPATFFVPTGTVGIKTSRDHMTWAQLQQMDKEGLVKIEGHTISHPEDLRKLDDEHVRKELGTSKKTLEEKLGRKVRFLAYPVGNADSRVAQIAHELGYEMAFTMGPGWSASPADALMVPRFYEGRIEEICRTMAADEPAWPATSHVVDVKPMDLESGELEDGQVDMRWIRGGRMCSVRIIGRQNVPELVHLTSAPAGLNGTFFSDARVNSVGAGIVGPIMSRFGPGFAPGLPGDRDRIAGRPLVVISPTRMAFLPFQPHLALDDGGVKRLIPDATDCFIAGAWLIHRGRPLTHDEMDRFHLTNIFDFRPRAFFGIDNQGRPFLGASSTGNQSDRLAESLAKLGLEEAVLLDSGFSTSLVLGNEVLVRGITRQDMAARPVPHALLLYPVDPKTNREVLVKRYTDPTFVGPPDAPTLPEIETRFRERPEMHAFDPEAPGNRRPARRKRGRRHR